MNDDDRAQLREASALVEEAEGRVIGVVECSPDGESHGRLQPHERAVLHEAAAELRNACTRLWNLSETSAE
jgi:hypothetical protein